MKEQDVMANQIESPWRPMSEAPRDGTAIIVLYDDFSGASIYAFDVEHQVWLHFSGLARQPDRRPFWEFWGDGDLTDGWGWTRAPQALQSELSKWEFPIFDENGQSVR